MVSNNFCKNPVGIDFNFYLHESTWTFTERMRVEGEGREGLLWGQGGVKEPGWLCAQGPVRGPPSEGDWESLITDVS